MNTRRLFWLPRISILAALVGAAVCLHPASRAVAEDAPTDVLMFCDFTPGTLPVYWALQRNIATGGRSVTTLTDSSAFGSELARREWSRVFVFAQRSAIEPGYAGALRAYITQHPNGTVDMYFWHENGIPPVKGTAVLADGAWVEWHQDFSTIAYNVNDAKPADVVAGHVFPDFATLAISAPTVVERIDLTPERAALDWIIIAVDLFLQVDTQCKREAAQRYMADVTVCDNNYNVDVGQCNALFPQPPANPTVAEQWQNCLRSASEGRNNCYTAALNRYKNGYELCKKLETQ